MSKAMSLAPAVGAVVLFLGARASAQTTILASLDSSGGQANGGSLYPAFSKDGRYVGFESAAQLVPGDVSFAVDIYLRGPELTLEAQPAVVTGGQLLTLTTFDGVPGHGASLWAVAVNGAPIFSLVYLGAFGGDRHFALSGNVPPGLGHADITFRTLAVGLSGFAVVASNDATVSFQ